MSLRGISFCITGVLCKERKEVFSRIADAGARVSKSVDSSTSFLVVGEKPGSTKLKAARKYGVPMIDEAKFWKMLPQKFRPVYAPSTSGLLDQKAGDVGVEIREERNEQPAGGEALAAASKRRFDWE